MPQTLARAATFAALAVLAALAALYLWYFAGHAALMLAHPYPLDYGEGPLLAQVEQLRAGTPPWRLYADPLGPPFLIVNYPPLYLLLSSVLAPPAGSALVAGRLLSLLGALGSVAAIALLARGDQAGWRGGSAAALAALLLLSVPIVREWSALMRVDMLGVCLGLWGLTLLRRSLAGGAGRAFLGGLLLCACLYTKPSLVAAPGAAALWLALGAARAPQAGGRAGLAALLGLGAALALGGLLFVALEWASGGWFALHVVAANANRWEAGLAWAFWTQQIALRWPLAAAALLAAWVVWRRGGGAALALPALYTMLGVAGAAGVGKVGAYSNYFLELYAGLVWLVALGARELAGAPPGARRRPGAALFLPAGLCLLLVAALLRYPPLWDETRLRPAGLLGPSPPRVAFGDYALWDDARREAELLAALARVYAALVPEARAARPVIFTDMPGVAAAAGVQARLPVFEARQLFDQGLADQDALLAELARGEPPLAVLDYLGNWLSPQMAELLRRRYAQDGSLGTFDLFRPVDPGPATPLDERFPAAGLRLTGRRLAAPAGATYEPGELLTLALVWRREPGAPAAQQPEVVVQLRDGAGVARAELRRPLLYGVLPPRGWPSNEGVEHMQPLPIPPGLPPGEYQLVAGLGPGDLRPIAALEVAPQGGRRFDETGHFVPAAVLRAWEGQGGVERAGYPLTPLVPFAWGRLQCFERSCLELRGQDVSVRPLGERHYLAETIRGGDCATGPGEMPAPWSGQLCPGFAAAGDLPEAAGLGAPISGELLRNGWVVQWTKRARLERPPGGGEVRLGRLGDDSLRLSPGEAYRWP